MTVHYEVDGKIIKHFKTALREAVKTDAEILSRKETRKNFNKGTVLMRHGILHVNYLSKVRKQWAVKRVKKLNTKLKMLSKVVKRSKYQKRKRTLKFVKEFNQLSYERQQRRLRAVWSKKRHVFRLSIVDMDMSEVKRELENKGCVFKQQKGG